MSRNFIRWTVLAVVAVAASAAQVQAQAGNTSGIPTVALEATQAPYLTLTVNSGGTQSIASITPDADNDFATPANVTAAWNLPSGTTLAIVGYFSSTDALVSGSNSIPSSRVHAAWNGGGFEAIDQGTVSGGANTIGTAGASRTFESIDLTNNLLNSVTRDLAFRLALGGFEPAAGTYAGTLNLRAIVQ